MFPKGGSVIKVFLLISLCCISYSSSEKEIPETKHFSKHAGAPTMNFQYWCVFINMTFFALFIGN